MFIILIMISNEAFNQPIKNDLKYITDKIKIIRNELLKSTDKYLLSDYPI